MNIILVKPTLFLLDKPPRAKASDFIAAADIGVSLILPTYFYKLSSLIKVLEYIVIAKPVIANEEIPEHKEVLEESGRGILTPFTL